MIHTIQLKQKEKITNDIYSFYFQKSADFAYFPGQYIKLFFENDQRSFTIASSPTEKEIMITTKLRQSDFKQKMLNLKENEPVKIEGPIGGFYFKPEIHRYVFLAGGMGITPFRSMIKFIVDKNLKNNITFLASFSNSKNVIFFDELKRIENSHPNISIIFTITNPEPGEDTFVYGRISASVIKQYVDNVKKPHYMIVGSPEFVSAMEDEVDSFGVKDEQIQIENFTGY